MTQLARGKTPATLSPKDLLLGRYALERKIRITPTTDLGHPEAFPAMWGMLANDRYGDCVLAGAAHETMLWSQLGSIDAAFASFSERTVLSDYTAITGFNPSVPSTDQGTNMRDAMNYRRKTGVLDSSGLRHKIGAFVALQAGNISQVKQALWLFGAVAVGIEFPLSAMDQFDANKPWTVVSGSQIDGGHYVPIVRYHAATDMFECVTWGRTQLVAPSFLQKYMDEGYGVLSEEMLQGGRSVEGFDLATLQQDLADIGSRVAPTPEPSPAPFPADSSDRQLWADTKAWSAARHVTCNKKAADAVKRWAADHGLV